MRLKLITTSAILVIAGQLAPAPATAQGTGQYAVTITNLTRDQTFTPVFVATHRPGIRLFELGQPALPQIALVAEEGDVAPLMALAQAATPFVHEVTFTGAPPGGFVRPGESRTITVGTRPGFDRVSVIAMLVPTNDGFFALRDAEGPSGTGQVTYTSPAYDAGSERNDETCASIPGPNYPECGGPGGGGQPSGAKRAMSTFTREFKASATSARTATGGTQSRRSRFVASRKQTATRSHAVRRTYRILTTRSRSPDIQ